MIITNEIFKDNLCFRHFVGNSLGNYMRKIKEKRREKINKKQEKKKETLWLK